MPAGPDDRARPERWQLPAQAVRRRRRRPRTASWLRPHAETLLLVLLASVVVGSVLAAGTVHVSVLLIVAPVALSCGLLAMWWQRLRIRDLPAPALLAGGLAVYSGLQAAPLPTSLLAAIAPANADVWARSLHGFGEAGPAWSSISLDPGASLIEALKWLSYACLFTAAAALGQRGRHAAVAGVVLAAGVSTALVSLGHGILGADALYGLYHPVYARPHWALAPLLNPNNLAGYLNLATFCGLGLLLSRRNTLRWWWLGLGVATLVGMTIITASRGGLLALILGCVAVGFTVSFARGLRRRSGRERADAHRPRSWPAVLTTLVGGIALALLGSNRAIYAGLVAESLEKLSLLTWIKPMILKHPWLGVGRGAFETAFAPFAQGSGSVLFAHAENFLVQWAAEWGLPVVVIGLAGFAWWLRPARLNVPADRLAAVCYVGLLALLVQNLADLALEVPSVSIAAFAVAGGLWGAGASGRRMPGAAAAASPAPAWGGTRRSPVSLALATVLCVVSLALAVAAGRHPALLDRKRLSELYLETDFAEHEAGRSFLRELHAALDRHPADPHLPLLGALAARRLPAVSPLPWLTQALERDPANGRPHFVLAELLARAGRREQALLELRLAAERSPELVGPSAVLAVKLTQSLDMLQRAVPEGTLGAPVLVQLARRLKPAQHRNLRTRLLEHALEHSPNEPQAHRLLAEDLIELLHSEQTSLPCGSRSQCVSRIREHIQAVGDALPQHATATILRARLLAAQSRYADAEQLLAQDCSRYRDPLGCWRERVLVASQLQPTDRLDAAMSAYLASACSQPAPCARAAQWLGDLLARRQAWAAAVGKYERAAREDPTPARWLRLAEAATQAGQQVRAQQALRRARAAGAAADPKLEQRLHKAHEQHLLKSLMAPRSTATAEP